MITATCFGLLRPSSGFPPKELSDSLDLCCYITMVRSHQLWYLLLLLVSDVALGGGVCDVGMRWLWVQSSRRCLSLLLSCVGFRLIVLSFKLNARITTVTEDRKHTREYRLLITTQSGLIARVTNPQHFIILLLSTEPIANAHQRYTSMKDRQ